MNGLELVARANRNGSTENWHLGAAAVVTPDNRLVARIGDPDLPVYLRSAAKPFQILPLLLAGGAERFSLGPADIALICASHAGLEIHAERTGSILERAGFSPEDLLCGVHPPFDPETRRKIRAAGESPTVLQNNCSGKHAGMLCACRLLGYEAADYTDPEHPLQRRILVELSSVADVNPEQVRYAVDGCSVPTFLLPLRVAARAYAALCDPESAGLSIERAAAASTVVEAMTSEPSMVAGPGRFATCLMEATGGRLLAKEGAQGYFAVGVRGPVTMGVVTKVADGDLRCRDGVVIDVLRQLGVLSAAEFEQLSPFYRVPITSHCGSTVGEVIPEVTLQEV